MYNKPTFINIGPGRSGTSWLYYILEQHPEICMSKIKETEFFNTNFEKGYSWYEKHFSCSYEHKAIGEISNNYYLDKTVAQKINDYNPEMKLIINIRYPPHLLNSYINFGIRRGLIFNSIDEALMVPVGKIMGSGYDYRFKKNSLTLADRLTLLEAVLLFDRLVAFFELFNGDNFFLLIFERIRTEPALLINEVYKFLGVNESFIPKKLDKPINLAIQPKSRLLASFASKMAFVLRRYGCNKLLMKLHASEALKKIIFNEVDIQKIPSWKDINTDSIMRIEDNIKKMINHFPILSSYWQTYQYHN